MPRKQAYKRLRSLATRFRSPQLAQIAIAAKTKGHFDEVITMIDKMIVLLREEEQEDITHRDRCERKENKNKNDKADAESEVAKQTAIIKRLTQEQKDKKSEIDDIKKAIKATEK